MKRSQAKVEQTKKPGEGERKKKGASETEDATGRYAHAGQLLGLPAPEKIVPAAGRPRRGCGGRRAAAVSGRIPRAAHVLGELSRRRSMVALC